MEAKRNSGLSDGSAPSLPYYARNHAYTWQRWTSWIILVGVIAHVIQMRFLEYPSSIQIGNEKFYVSRIKDTTNANALSTRLGVKLYHQENFSHLKETIDPRNRETLEQWPLKEDRLLAVSPSFGTAVLLMVRNTFQSLTMVFLYTIFVMVTTFHAFNGLWTWMITWGITLTARSQALMRKVAIGLMVVVTLFGFAAIWGIYLGSRL
jgi:succinate dehydrogenase / fumarate reductase cytochrome b subunit